MKTQIKTIIVVPNFTASTRSLRLFMFLLKFSDMFLFSEDLELLIKLMANGDNVFLDYLIDKLNMVYPESKPILEILKQKGKEFITHKELSKQTSINVNKVRRLFYTNHLSFEKLGIIEKFGSYCRLNERFVILF